MGDLPTDSLPGRFFSEARSALLESKAGIDIAPTDILTIANDAAMRAEFRELFLRHTNDPELKRLIRRYLQDVADNLEDAAEIAEIDVDLIDRAALTPAAGATVAGIVATIATGGTLGPVVLLAGGLFGMATSGVGRNWKKRLAQRTRSSRRKVLRLIEDLE